MASETDEVLRRISSIATHLCHGEAKHKQTDDDKNASVSAGADAHGKLFRFRYDRRPVKVVVFETDGGHDSYGGLHDAFVLEGDHLVPSSTSPDVESTVVVFMHPSAVMNLLPYPIALARAGVPVVTMTSRFVNNDSALVMEKVVKDLGAVINHCRDYLGYERVVLCGWSGGGSLAAFYQSQAESPSVTSPVDLTDADLPEADALLMVACHASRAQILCEFLDPTIYLLRRGQFPKEEAELAKYSLYGPHAAKPPFSPEFVATFRRLQRERMERITEWVESQLQSGIVGESECFVVDGTMADPRWMDPAVDPNDRTQLAEPPSCFLGNPEQANNAIAGLARFCSYKSWLSQWSWQRSNADGVSHIARVTVPVIFIENSADDGVPRSHMRSLFNACNVPSKSYHVIQGANHYYTGAGMQEKLAESINLAVRWMHKQDLVNIAPPSTGVAFGSLTRHDRSAGVVVKGINHLALVCDDMQRTQTFFCDYLNMRVVKTIALPDGGQHFFFDIDGSAPVKGSALAKPPLLAYFWFPGAKPGKAGVSAPDMSELIRTGNAPSSGIGSMNHLAFQVEDKKMLRRVKKQLRLAAEQGLCSFVTPTTMHADNETGYTRDPDDKDLSWTSVYCLGPSKELLEFTVQSTQVPRDGSDASHAPVLALWR